MIPNVGFNWLLLAVTLAPFVAFAMLVVLGS